MSTFLIKTTEQYRCDTEEEAILLIEKAKKNNQYTVVKSSNEMKVVKSKGEVVDEYRRVVITKEFNEEKNPDSFISLEYNNMEEEI